MPKPEDDRPQPEPPPVRPPTLPPDFPDIPQNPSSELQPPPDPSATPDKVAGATPAAARTRNSDKPRRSPRRHSPMRSWISGPRPGLFRQGVSLVPEDFRESRRPVIVTEQQADPVELLYQGFRPLDAEQRRRLLGRIARS